ncbi:MAG: translation initiation factor [Verrucomicrobiae bacterium]|nr:translation initiation factor [Verrucomicrobiae bacterium]
MPRHPRRDRIDTGADGAPLASPFAALDIAGLPPAPAPAPDPRPGVPPTQGARLVIRREKSGRGGKTVLVVSGFPRTWTSAHIAELAARLKRALGTGGSAEAGTIEIQGNDPARLRALLEREGFRAAGP